MLEGLPPNNAAHVLRLRCGARVAQHVVDVVTEFFDPAETAAAAFEETASTPSWKGNEPWLVEIFFGRPPDVDLVRHLLTSACGEALAATAEFAELAKRDWVATSLEGLEAVREGRIVVHGAHGRSRVKTGDIGIEIEAALAFGTGHHGTTRGCLAALNAVGRRRRPARVLDVGTGTGVLAIAAAKRWRRRVLAGDLDPVAVATAAANARFNQVGGLVETVLAKGTANPRLRAGSPYDLVFANILARPLKALAPALRPLLAPGGEVVLSGLLGSDVPGVLSAYRAQGLVLRGRRDIEGWATLMMRRPAERAG